MAHLAARCELADVGLDVEHGRAVDRVEAADVHLEAVDADAAREDVQAFLGLLRERGLVVEE